MHAIIDWFLLNIVLLIAIFNISSR